MSNLKWYDKEEGLYQIKGLPENYPYKNKLNEEDLKALEDKLENAKEGAEFKSKEELEEYLDNVIFEGLEWYEEEELISWLYCNQIYAIE